MTDRQVYLDYGAATPVAPEVLEAMLPYLRERFYNPSAPYALARGVRAEPTRKLNPGMARWSTTSAAAAATDVAPW